MPEIKILQFFCLRACHCHTNVGIMLFLLSLFTKNEIFHLGFLQLMWPNPQETADLVTFTEEILYEKLHFLCSECIEKGYIS